MVNPVHSGTVAASCEELGESENMYSVVKQVGGGEDAPDSSLSEK